MSRSFALERVRIQIEICLETIGDFLLNTGDKLRKPLIVLAGIALVMTLRSARKGVRTMKPGLTSGAHDSTEYRPSASLWGSSSGLGSSLGSGLYGGASSGSSSGGGYAGYGSSSSSSYGGSNGLGTTNGGNLRASSTGPTRATAELVDIHGSSARVMDAASFHDYGGITEFYGRAETLSAFEGAGVVDKVLQSSGEGKILVVDGGGNKESAIFDAKAARTAQQNGWKGVIINGVVRNAKELSTFSIGIKALGTSPKKGQATSGSKGSVVTIGGMNFSPGDNVYCDTDGIIVSDRDLRAESSQTSGSAMSATPGTGSTSTSSMELHGNSMGTASTGGSTVPGYPSGGYGSSGMSAAQTGNSVGGNIGTTGSSTYGSTGSLASMGGASGYGAGASAPGYGTAAGYGSTSGYGSLPQPNSYGSDGGYDAYEKSSYSYSSAPRRYRWTGGALSAFALSVVLSIAAIL